MIPPRFRAVLDGLQVECLACRYPMRLNAEAYERMNYEVKRWIASHPGEQVPLHMLRLSMRCLNGHSESWAGALPALRFEPEPVESSEQECECGRTFVTRAGKEAKCQPCRAALSRRWKRTGSLATLVAEADKEADSQVERT